jgi:hypothetical protein
MFRFETVTAHVARFEHGETLAQPRREAEYVADIRRRIAHVRGDDTPLFNPEAA